MSELLCISYRRRIGIRFTLPGGISRCGAFSHSNNEIAGQSLITQLIFFYTGLNSLAYSEHQLLISSLARVPANMIIAAWLQSNNAKTWLVDERDSTHQLMLKNLPIMLALYGLLDDPPTIPKAMLPHTSHFPSSGALPKLQKMKVTLPCWTALPYLLFERWDIGRDRQNQVQWSPTSQTPWISDTHCISQTYRILETRTPL